MILINQLTRKVSPTRGTCPRALRVSSCDVRFLTPYLYMKCTFHTTSSQVAVPLFFALIRKCELLNPIFACFATAMSIGGAKLVYVQHAHANRIGSGRDQHLRLIAIIFTHRLQTASEYCETL